MIRLIAKTRLTGGHNAAPGEEFEASERDAAAFLRKRQAVEVPKKKAAKRKRAKKEG